MCPQCTGTDVFETGSEAPVDVVTGAIGSVEPTEAPEAEPVKTTKAKP